MFLNLDNEIDKKLSKLYSEEVINNMKNGIMEYLGVNISETPDEDIQLKIYYENNPSYKLYKESQSNDSLIEFLYEKNMISFLETVYDKNNSQFNRYNVKIKNRYKNNMLELFEFWEKIVPFLLGITKQVGCKYIYLFAADKTEEFEVSNVKKLVRYYKNVFKFYECDEDDLIIVKPDYDMDCYGLIQEVSKLEKNRDAVWHEFSDV